VLSTKKNSHNTKERKKWTPKKKVGASICSSPKTRHGTKMKRLFPSNVKEVMSKSSRGDVTPGKGKKNMKPSSLCFLNYDSGREACQE